MELVTKWLLVGEQAVAGQMDFYLLTMYFGCGLLLSPYGCYLYINLSRSVSKVEKDAEQGSYTPLIGEEATNRAGKRNISNPREEDFVYRLPGIWNYALENLFQLTIDLHSVNVVLLLGDAALNCLRVPFFRISFFVLWTVYLSFPNGSLMPVYRSGGRTHFLIWHHPLLLYGICFLITSETSHICSAIVI
ncbi:hypothetical protein TIFTF001_011750 [Ficus carica]|uniref:Uncharacterized protein n=1 Tax=Ficus carica TaxID=3494 RepID=A0AA88A0I1_FICCA|nr:hypothetical protein TIFTF001_011750 [Ficus carica]